MKSVLVHALAAAVLITGLSVVPGCNGARDTAKNALSTTAKSGFISKKLVRGNRTRNYSMFVPTTYRPETRYPVIIFLHGVGEGGSDAQKNLTVGLAPFVADRMGEFPFICIFPQSESGGWDENSDAATDVIACLDDVSKTYNVDADRVILTGLSTGGYGTYAIGAKYKDRFAALVPMASNANATKWASDLVNMPIRAYCNGGDMFGGFGGNDRGMVERIKTLGGKNQEYTQTNDAGHNCWEGVYGSGELFSWMLQQRRRGTASTATPIRTTSSITPAPKAVTVTPVSTTPAKTTPAKTTSSQGSGASALVPTPY